MTKTVSSQGIPWSKNEMLLKQQLMVGDRWEKWLASMIMKLGHPCTTQPLRIRQHIDDADEFGDQVDIEVYGKVIEVKSRNLVFHHNPPSFPYPDPFVDTVSGWEKKSKKPDAYVCVSQKTKGIICLPGSTRELWEVKRMRDHTRGIVDDFYVCDIKHWRHGRSLARSLDAIRRRQ